MSSKLKVFCTAFECKQSFTSFPLDFFFESQIRIFTLEKKSRYNERSCFKPVIYVISDLLGFLLFQQFRIGWIRSNANGEETVDNDICISTDRRSKMCVNGYSQPIMLKIRLIDTSGGHVLGLHHTPGGNHSKHSVQVWIFGVHRSIRKDQF